VGDRIDVCQPYVVGKGEKETPQYEYHCAKERCSKKEMMHYQQLRYFGILCLIWTRIAQ
jgi:hypothetical protein